MGKPNKNGDTPDGAATKNEPIKEFQEQFSQAFPVDLKTLGNFQQQNWKDLLDPKALSETIETMRQLLPMAKFQELDQDDIFLSYRSVDHDRVGDLKENLEGLGYTVYWDREDSVLGNKPVTKETAAHLRARMRCCRALVFAVSSHYGESLWMPWELGFFDGRTGCVFVYPLDEGVLEHKTGQQYLDFYPLVDIKNVKAWLEERLPHEEPPLPWRGPAGAEATDDYGGWFARNAGRIMTDPQFAMELIDNLWRAWFRLLAGASDRG